MVYRPQWTVKGEGPVLNATSASLLALLDECGDEVTGAELARLAQTRIGDFGKLTRSQVYRELAALEDAGHVVAGAPGPRAARPYRLSAAGRREYRRWLAEELPDETVRIPLLLAVGFGRVLPPGRLQSVLDQAEATHRAKLAAYRALDEELAAAGADPFARATLSFGLHYEEAVLRWFESLPDEVRRA